MLGVAVEFQDNSALIVLICASIAWYVAARAAVDALAGDAPAPGLRAIGYWMPMALVALIAAAGNQPEIAVGVAFGASVACVSLVVGVVTLTSPPSMIVVGERRRWAFLLPTAVLAILAGFKARLTPLHAAIFLAEGLVLLWLWLDRSAGPDRQFENVATRISRRRPIVWGLQILLAIVLALVAATAAVIAGSKIGAAWNLPGNSLVASMLIGPALVVPLVGNSTLMAQRDQYSAAVSTCVGVALLNLCLLIPLVVVTWNLSHVPAQTPLLQWPRAAITLDRALYFPPSIWRVDATFLMLLGMWLMPISVGRWMPGRAEGVGLIICYAAYLILSGWANRFW